MYSDRRQADDVIRARRNPDLGQIQIPDDLVADPVLEPSDVVVVAQKRTVSSIQLPVSRINTRHGFGTG